MMTHPIFTSLHSGLTIDMKYGIWKDGKYIDVPLRLINFSALNHHSSYAGVTASIKNLMGIVDLTCGYPGNKPKGYYNMHYLGKENQLYKLGTRIREELRRRGFKILADIVKNVYQVLGISIFTIRVEL